jgi:hypothetical protein
MQSSSSTGSAVKVNDTCPHASDMSEERYREKNVLTFGKRLGSWPARYERPEYGHCYASRGLVKEHDSYEEFPWVMRNTFWYEIDT